MILKFSQATLLCLAALTRNDYGSNSASAFSVKPSFLPSSPTTTTSTLFLSADNVLTSEAPPSSLSSLSSHEGTEAHHQQQEYSTAIRAPLKFLGPYPVLGLRFPNAATSSQRARNVTGVSLDFVLDTAANTNTINAQVAQELQLPIVGQALPGVSSSGMLSGGDTYELGDTQLEGASGTNTIVTRRTEQSTKEDEESIVMEGAEEEPFIFMQNLTASALPIASPASAGLLSLAFMYCFEGGVEFHWGSSSPTTALKDGQLVTDNLPSVTFFGDKEDVLAKQSIEGMTKVTIDPIPVTQLPSVLVNINGVTMPALLDTGSPITVINSQAMAKVNIETIQLPSNQQASKNPFAAVANRFKDAQAMAQAAAKGDVLTIGGMNGPVNLLKSTTAPEISIQSAANNDDDSVSFGTGHVYVGEIPGLAALNGLGVDAPPAVVLGMDVLRRRPKMVLRAQDNEVYF